MYQGVHLNIITENSQIFMKKYKDFHATLQYDRKNEKSMNCENDDLNKNKNKFCKYYEYVIFEPVQ